MRVRPWGSVRHTGAERHAVIHVEYSRHGFVGILRRRRSSGSPCGHADRSRSGTRAKQRFRVLSATREEEKLGTDPLVEMDMAQFPFQMPPRPKFKPFVGQSDVADLLYSYRHKVSVKEGVLHILPMTLDHVSDASQLLSDSFSEAVGYMPIYKGFLKRQVEEYLRSHINIAPKAIILVAILKPEDDPELSDWTGEAASSVTWFERPGPSEEAEDDATSADDSAATESSPQPADEDSLGSEMSTDTRASELPPSESASALTATAVTMDSSERRATTADTVSQEMSPAALNLESQVQGSSPSAPEDQGASALPATAGVASRAEEAEGVMGQSLESAGAEEEGIPVDDFEAQLEAAELAERERGELVGTVELSFSPSTRTPSMTLNPPADAAYLCNMAVGEQFQRRGYGLRILTAAEEIVRVAGYRRVYLHVRLKDEPAKALYDKAGYELEKEDCWLVALWDDRRRLLSKFIPQQQAAQAEPEPEEEDSVPAEYEL